MAWRTASMPSIPTASSSWAAIDIAGATRAALRMLRAWRSLRKRPFFGVAIYLSAFASIVGEGSFIRPGAPTTVRFGDLFSVCGCPQASSAVPVRVGGWVVPFFFTLEA